MVARGVGTAAALDSAVRAAAEAVTLEDLDAEAVPLLKRAFGAQLIALPRFNDSGAPEFKAGDLQRCEPAVYFQHYFADDPITTINRRANSRILVYARHVERDRFESSPAYHEYYRPRDIRHILCARLLGSAYYAAGGSMIGFFRARSQPEFTRRDARTLARILPALEAVARRGERVLAEGRTRSVLEALCSAGDPRPRAALDVDGRLLWASPRAEALLAPFLGGGRPLPVGLTDAARRLAAFNAGGGTLDDVNFSVAISGAGGVALQIELHLARTRGGAPFVVADLAEARRPPMDLAARHGLTPAESAVLDALALGLSNAEIARQSFISVATVKTHVHRLLQKLGVSSRLQAALLRGAAPLPRR